MKKKLSIALGGAIFVLAIGTQLILKHYFDVDINPGMCVLIGILIGLSATVGYVYSKLEDLYEE